MNKRASQAASQIEETQAALRASIEQAMRLADELEGMLLRGKRTIDEQAAPVERDAYPRDNPN